MDLLFVAENSTTHTPAYRSSLEAICLPSCNNNLFSSGTNQKSRFVQVYIRKRTPRFISLAGVSGFEPENAGFKALCLTAWLHPNEWRSGEDSNPCAVLPTYQFSRLLSSPAWVPEQKNGQSLGIRTLGLSLPKRALYQTKLNSDGEHNWICTNDYDVADRCLTTWPYAQLGRSKRIELLFSAPQADVLPLH